MGSRTRNFANNVNANGRPINVDVAEFDDNKIVNDISTLGLRVHTQENLNASVEISFTILLSSKDVACWDTALAGILASAIEPVNLLAANEGILSAPRDPVVILLASRLGISAASKSIAGFLILIIAII